MKNEELNLSMEELSQLEALEVKGGGDDTQNINPGCTNPGCNFVVGCGTNKQDQLDK